MDGVENLKRILQEQVDSLKDRILAIADYLHQNPELGYAETKACQRLVDELEKSGFKVTKGVAGLSTAFKAVLPGESRKPIVGILGEYDALPEIGHACGHNLSAASAVGAAMALAKLMPKLPGNLMSRAAPKAVDRLTQASR